MPTLSDLRAEHLREPLGLPTGRPRFSWVVEAPGHDVVQQAYEVEVRREAEDQPLWSSGRVPSADSVLVRYGGPVLESGTRYTWRVRVEAGGERSAWTESAFETGLLRRADWTAEFVEPQQDPVTPDGPTRVDGDWVPPRHEGTLEDRLHPVQYLRQVLELPSRPVRARLYATAHGVYATEINGVPVGDEVLAPGYESYDKYLSFQTYDVTDLLTAGRNALGVVLGDGWYAGRISFTGASAQYGDRLRAGWQLAVDLPDGERRLITSDQSVVSCADGPIRYSDIFIGERHDARRQLPGWSTPDFDDSTWTPVSVVPAPAALVPFVGEPVRRVLHLSAREVITTPGGDTVVDFGQVIAGRVRMDVSGPAGTTVTLEHSEVLDQDGNFFLNIGGFNKDQTDVYVLSGDPDGECWEPLFTFHGFRYVRVTGYPGPVAAGAFHAVVIASDVEPAGSFRCSDERITQLHHNVVWSQRGNFLSIPTDCPQRERAGWTGDLQVFAAAATTNARVVPFLTRWLRNLRADQWSDGTVPVMVPVPPGMQQMALESPDDPLLSITAAAGWGDAVTIVPWTLYERYGDAGVLADNFAAMQAWVERQIQVAENELPPRLRGQELSDAQRRRQQLLWNSEPNFGDWLAPSVEKSLDGMLAAARISGELVAPMFHGHSAELLARAAEVLGRDADATRYRSRARMIREAFAEEYLDGRGGLLVQSQGMYVLALALGFVPDAQREAAVARLVELVHEAEYHLDTGFLSVPFLLDSLWDNGQRGLARALLWQHSAPSWLYAVDRGATTIWEQWDAIGPEGQVEPTSFNHYAFGCVDDWLYRRLAGIQAAAPGFREIRVEPDFDTDLAWVAAHHDTPYGRLEVRWERDADDPARLTVDLLVPANTTASLGLPENAVVQEVLRGGQRGTALPRSFGSGHTTVTFRRSR